MNADLQEALNELSQKAAQEAFDVAEDYDRKYKTGGKIEDADDSSEPTEAGADDQPETSETPPESQPPAESVWETFLGGKFAKTADPKVEAEKSAHEAWATIKRLNDEKTALQAQLAQFAVPRQSPQERVEERKNALTILEEQYGIPEQIMREAVSAEAQGVIHQFFKPIEGAMAAENYMLETYGDTYQARGREYQKWLSSTPEVKALVDAAEAAGQPVLAREFGWTKFLTIKGAEVEKAQEVNKAVRDEVVAEAKKDATIVKGQRVNGKPKPGDEKWLEADDMDQIRKHWGQGRRGPLIRELTKSLPDELFS